MPGTSNVLVVDDDPVVTDLMVYKLTRLGCVVRSAPDAESALLAIGTDPPDLVFVDWMLPGMTGPALCAALRAAGAKHLPMVLLSAKIGAQYVAEALAAGADEYLTKPVRPAELAALVGRLLGPAG